MLAEQKKLDKYDEKRFDFSSKVALIGLFISIVRVVLLYLIDRIPDSPILLTLLFSIPLIYILIYILLKLGALSIAFFLAFVIVPLLISLTVIYIEQLTGVIFFLVYHIFCCFFIIRTKKIIEVYCFINIGLFLSTCFLEQSQKNPSYKADSILIIFNYSLFIIGIYFIVKILSHLILKAQEQLEKNRIQITEQNKQLSDNYNEMLSYSHTLEEKNKQISDAYIFTSQISGIILHDLKTPVIAIKNLLTLFQNKQIAAKDIEANILHIDKAVTQITDLIREFPTFSDFEKIITNPGFTTIYIKEIIDEIIVANYGLVLPKGIKINNNISQKVKVFTSYYYLKIILRNLISNAIKFSFNKSHIDIRCLTTNDSVVIQIIDYGIGISEDNLTKINQGIQFTTIGTSKETGTGIGLLFCREYAQKCQAKFNIYSTKKGGTRAELIFCQT